MANTKSSQKRIELNKRNKLQNKYYKTSTKTLTKFFFATLQTYKEGQNLKDQVKLSRILSSIYSIVDKGTKKHIFHKNNAARKKAKLASYLKAS